MISRSPQIGQRFLQDLLDFVFQHLLGRGFDRIVGFFIFDEIAEIAVFAFAHGAVERDRVPADFHRTRRVSLTDIFARLAISSMVGSRPHSCISTLLMLRSLLIVSIMWTGMRIVRA